MISLQKIPNKKEVYALMEPLWRKTYSFLPKEQVTLLLHKYFDPENIEAYEAQGYVYRYFMENDTIGGLVVYTLRDKDLYLDKLYLTEAMQGKRYASFIFAYLKDFERDIVLNVNQNNKHALEVYKHAGFEIESEERIVLNDHLENLDYIMRFKYAEQKITRCHED